MVPPTTINSITVPVGVPVGRVRVRLAVHRYLPPATAVKLVFFSSQSGAAPMSAGDKASLPPVACVDLCAVGVRASLSRESAVTTAVPVIALGDMPDDGALVASPLVSADVVA